MTEDVIKEEQANKGDFPYRSLPTKYCKKVRPHRWRRATYGVQFIICY
ncbi:hypothetical protein Salpa_0440 [Sporomusa sp. KB1]|jgi:hypothetical protein|nr:hypothetical protein Salpa_0440 [Sporomusa sp. KB1]